MIVNISHLLCNHGTDSIVLTARSNFNFEGRSRGVSDLILLTFALVIFL